MPHLKRLKEERADIINQMEALHKEKAETGFDDEATRQWSDWKERLEEISHVINREEFLAQKKAEQASQVYDRNPDDGEDKELAKYSLAQAIRQASDRGPEGFYREMSQEAERELREAGVTTLGSNNALYIPLKVLARRSQPVVNAMTAGVPADGGNAVPTELRSFIDHLWAKMVTPGLGADLLTGLTGNIDFPTEATPAGFSWAATEVAELTESKPKLGLVQLTPKRGGTFVDISNQLLKQTSPSIDGRIVRQIITAAQVGLESAGIAGPGTGGAPKGILNTAGIGAVYAGGAADNDTNANGAAPKREDVINLETAIAIENADVGSLAYLTNAKVRGTLKNTAVDAGSGLFVWPMSANELNGYRAAVTNLVPSNLEKGTSETLSAMIFGNFNDLVYGMWGGLEVLHDPYTQALKGTTRLVLNMYCDVAVLRPKSFAACKDIQTS